MNYCIVGCGGYLILQMQMPASCLKVLWGILSNGKTIKVILAIQSPSSESGCTKLSFRYRDVYKNAGGMASRNMREKAA
jgi:hypothetical protein